MCRLVWETRLITIVPWQVSRAYTSQINVSEINKATFFFTSMIYLYFSRKENLFFLVPINTVCLSMYANFRSLCKSWLKI